MKTKAFLSKKRFALVKIAIALVCSMLLVALSGGIAAEQNVQVAVNAPAQVPIFMWSFMDAETVRVLVSMPMGKGVSGSGCLAEVEFEVKGRSGDKSSLDISNGLLVDTEAKEIEAVWYGGEVRIEGEKEEKEPTPTPIQEAPPAEKTTPTPTAPPSPEEKPTSTPKPAVPGFEAVFAIAVMALFLFYKKKTRAKRKKGDKRRERRGE